jgi:hypothetical protein
VHEAAAILLDERSEHPGTRPPASSKALPREAEGDARASREPRDDEPPAAESDTRDAEERTAPEPEATTEEAGAAEPPEQDAEAPEGTTEEPEYELKVGDKLERVKLSELQKGYLRQQDYSRKSAENANARKAFESEVAEVRGERAAYGEMLGRMQAQIEAGGQHINWDELERTDPAAWAREKIRAQERERKLDAIRQEQQRLVETKGREQQQLIAQAREEARQILLQRVPAWQQPEVAQREISEMSRVAVEHYGYRIEELDRIFDPRLVLMMRDAAAYRKSRGLDLDGKKVAPSPGRTVPAKRHVPNTDPNATRRQAAQVQFRRAPSINSAVDAILAERGES